MIVDSVDNFAASAILLGETHLSAVDGMFVKLFIAVDGLPRLNTSVDNARVCFHLIFNLFATYQSTNFLFNFSIFRFIDFRFIDFFLTFVPQQILHG